MSKKFWIFDIEAGGLQPEYSSTISISTLNQDRLQSFYARPEGYISKWSQTQVWEPVKNKAGITSEKQALHSFLSVLQQNKGATFAGWNIGTPTGGGFDIPFLLKRAEGLGLRPQFEEAFSQVEIRDIGKEFAYKLSKNLAPHKDVIHESLWRSLEKYRDVGLEFEKQGFTERQASTLLAQSGYQISGWKQEQMYELLTGKKYQAHQSEMDILALQELQGKEIPSTREFAEKWNRVAMRQKTISSALAGAPAWEETETFYDSLINRAKTLGITDAESAIEEEASKRGADISRIRAGLGFQEELQKVGKKIGFSGQSQEVLQAIKRHPLRSGVIGLAGLALFGNLFSGKDDEYNTIEGLRHEGLAGQQRRELTDFGSGYRGLLKSKSFWKATGIGAGILGLGFGTYKLNEYLEERRQERENYLSSIKHKFAGYTAALSKYGVYAGTGHKRYLIPKTELSEQDLEELGFEGTLFAIPESGQDVVTSFRNPSNPYHIHSHGENWSVHKDRHAAITMSMKKAFSDNEPLWLNALQAAAAIPSGLAHIALEGIPGAFYYLRGQLTNAPEMSERIRTEMGNKFSGKDDDYNTIEGLRHGGLAELKRKELTDFGSGWIRRAISKGVGLEKIAAASKTLGKELTIQETAQGTRWLVGKRMGKGGFGEVFEAFEAESGRAGIYKHIGEAKQLSGAEQIISPAFKHKVFRSTSENTMELMKSQATREEFQKRYLAPTSELFVKTVQEYGGMGSFHEAAMQRLAREKFGNIVPDVYGETSTGIFMESAGKSLKDNPLEEVKALEWMQKEWAGKQLSQGSKFDELGNLIENTDYLYHFDPQIGNIMKKGDRYMMIDWGVAAKTTTPISRETRYAAEDAFEEYVNIHRVKLKEMQQSMHNKAVRDAAKNSLRPGRQHTKTAGTLVI